MSESKLRTQSMNFAVSIINLLFLPVFRHRSRGLTQKNPLAFEMHDLREIHLRPVKSPISIKHSPKPECGSIRVFLEQYWKWRRSRISVSQKVFSYA